VLIAAWVSYCWRLLVTGLSFIVFGVGGLLVPLLATPVVIGCSPPTLSKQHRWYHVPKERFVMSFAVKDDIAVAPFLHCPPSAGSRRLTARLEQFFTEECQAHGH
jgi:hypothetical protein